MILIFVSCESKKDAIKIANYLVDNKLAACVSLIPVQSFYFWKGKKLSPLEIEVIIKTKKEKFSIIQKAIKDLFPYEIPQIIQVAVKDANKEYVKWVDNAVR